MLTLKQINKYSILYNNVTVVMTDKITSAWCLATEAGGHISVLAAVSLLFFVYVSSNCLLLFRLVRHWWDFHHLLRFIHWHVPKFHTICHFLCTFSDSKHKETCITTQFCIKTMSKMLLNGINKSLRCCNMHIIRFSVL